MPLFGWLPHSQRNIAQQQTHAAIVAAMPAFRISGPWKAASDKAVLWTSCQKLRNGKHLPALFQSVGSCTGHGKAKTEWILQHVQAVLDPHFTPILPYEPYGYAQGRVCAGIAGNEDGGTGSGCADAARKYGVLRADFANLPAPMVEDGSMTLRTPGAVDRSWGVRGCPSKEDINEGIQHPVRTTSPIRSSNEAAQAIQNGYPFTIASDWGGIEDPRNGTVCPLEGNPQVRLNHHASNWPHQMMVDGWWRHPTLGEIFHVNNSWGEKAHGDNPDDAPPGGFWVSARDIDYIAGQMDSFAYSSVNGFPAAESEVIPWIFA